MPGMQFPYPRKSSNPSIYPPVRSSSYRQRRALRTYGPVIGGVVTLIWLFLWLLRGPSTPSYTSHGITTRAPPGTPQAVIVTTFDPSLPERYKETIKENRRHYASRHNYATFFPNTTDYDLASQPASWSVVPALRHAMTLYPHTPWIWYLSSTALIMATREDLPTRLTAPRRLESLMLTDRPVVPPDSVIRTFSHVRGERVDLVLSQDEQGLAGDSLLLRSGDWARFFLDAWFDPLYRTYNFQKAEAHALEHIVQWHGTVLAKMALVPQREMNSYTREVGKKTGSAGAYEEGDFVANFHGCHTEPDRDCETEMGPLMTRWRELRDHA